MSRPESARMLKSLFEYNKTVAMCTELLNELEKLQVKEMLRVLPTDRVLRREPVKVSVKTLGSSRCQDFAIARKMTGSFEIIENESEATFFELAASVVEEVEKEACMRMRLTKICWELLAWIQDSGSA